MGKVVNINAYRTSIQTDKAEITADEAVVKKVTKRVVAQPIEGGISPEQKAELNKLVREIGSQLVTMGKHANEGSAQARVRIAYRDKFKIPNIHEFHASKYNDVIRYLKNWKSSNNRNPKLAGRSEAWKKNMFAAINAKKRDLKLTENQYRSFLAEHYRAESLHDLSDADLISLNQQFDSAKSARGIKTVYSPPKVHKSIQTQREEKLSEFLQSLKASNPDVDFNALPFATREDVRGELINMFPEPPNLFKTISADTFNGFWSKQSLCKLGIQGRPTGTKS